VGKNQDQTNILSLESAVAGGSIALICSERGTFLRNDGNNCSRAEKILTVIAEVLDDAGLTLQDLSMVAVSTGPGSYSGIRIGLSTALGLANALNITCVGVSVLEAMAHSASFPKSLITAIPVGKNDVAWQAFGPPCDKKRVPATQPELVSYSTFVKKLEEMPAYSILAHPDVLEKIRDRIPRAGSSIDTGSGLAEFVGHLASLEDQPNDIPQPIYLRNRDAVIRENTF
jgi:tRNA threonylcarbamoyl adenosine modification protein YeaZ